MTLTDAQRVWLQKLAQSSDGEQLRAIMEGYKQDILQDVLFERLSAKEGQKIVEVLDNFLNKLAVATQKDQKQTLSEFL